MTVAGAPSRGLTAGCGRTGRRLSRSGRRVVARGSIRSPRAERYPDEDTTPAGIEVGLGALAVLASVMLAALLPVSAGLWRVIPNRRGAVLGRQACTEPGRTRVRRAGRLPADQRIPGEQMRRSDLAWLARYIAFPRGRRLSRHRPWGGCLAALAPPTAATLRPVRLARQPRRPADTNRAEEGEKSSWVTWCSSW